MMRLRWITPNLCLGSAVGLLFACTIAAPQLVYKLGQDGGFVESGEQINLGRWTRISANRNASAILAINRPDRDPPMHFESWINVGQWLRFDHVRATRRSRFTAEVRVHPEWPRDRATEVTFSVTAQGQSTQELRASLTPSITTQTEWTLISLELSALAGRDVSIKIVPTANQEVWTLMRDPKIMVSPAPTTP